MRQPRQDAALPAVSFSLQKIDLSWGWSPGLGVGHSGDVLHDFFGVYVFDVGGDGPAVAVGVGDAGHAVAVELVFRSGVGCCASLDGAGVDGFYIGDVEVDVGAGGGVFGDGVGDHEGRAVDFDLGVAYAAAGHGDAQALYGSEGGGQEVEHCGGVFDDEVGGDGSVAVGDGVNGGHGGSCLGLCGGMPGMVLHRTSRFNGYGNGFGGRWRLGFPPSRE